MKTSFIGTFFAFYFLAFAPFLHASKSKPFPSEEVANEYLITHYNLACKYYNQGDWRDASEEFEKVIYFFPNNETAADAAYYLAICYFERKEFDFANTAFSNYLKASQHPAFFEDAIYYKFCIAEYFKKGKKRRPFEIRYLPKWMSAQDLALTIYDEIITALPSHELTIQALYSKADLLKKMGEYRDCVETYQTLIRRFPKHEIVPICYLNISETYFQQSRYEFQNPDILALAELNVRKFKEDFPRDERVAMAQNNVCRIKELYAKGLYDLGRFYERMDHPDAAVIYYQSSIEEFPDTQIAQLARSRLICLGYEDICPGETSFTPLPAPEPQVEEEIEQEKSPETNDETLSLTGQLQETQHQHLLLAYEGNILADEANYPHEYVHYSLLKKKEVEHDVSKNVCESQPVKEQIEGEVPSSYTEKCQEENKTPYLWHYSVIKERGVHVPSEE